MAGSLEESWSARGRTSVGARAIGWPQCCGTQTMSPRDGVVGELGPDLGPVV